jgi:hypothetical protein
MSSRLCIIVTGLIAQHPYLGGLAWHYVQYIAGLARLGHDVYYFEDSGEWPYNLNGGVNGNDWIAHDCSGNVEHLAKVMSHFGHDGKWAYRFPITGKWFGLSASKRREILQSADLLLNISGTLEHPEDYREVRRLVYIDTDPVFTQIKLNLRRGHSGFQKRVQAHDIHFSFGECLSDRVSSTARFWLPTRMPIVLSEWRPSPFKRNVFTTVMNWTSYKSLRYEGEIYGQKDFEFRKFLELPRLVKTAATFEVALSKIEHIDWQTQEEGLPEAALNFLRLNPDSAPRDLLRYMGWRVVDATTVCPDLDSYHSYIESSKGEWSVAKNGYVRGRPGWFSDRSACYLAAGKPVVVQETGFGKVLPVGRGILTFSTVEEAVQAMHGVNANYRRHSKAAREIAEEYFDSDKVLKRLIDQTVSSSSRSILRSKEFCHAS